MRGGEGRGVRGHARGVEGMRLERRGARGAYTAKNKTHIHAKKRGREE